MKANRSAPESDSAFSNHRAMSIRDAASSDAITIALLMHQLGYEITQTLIRAKLHAFETSPADKILVATIDDAVIGVIGLHAMPLFHQAGSMGRITSLVVDARHRGSGVGAALIAAAERWFTAAGCMKIEVTSADHRAGAHRFYERHGYRRDGQRFSKPIPPPA